MELQQRFILRLVLLLVGLIFFGESAPSAQSLNDATMLLAFKAQIWNDPFASLGNWKLVNTTGHACFWNGVQCADLTAYRVSSLILTGVGLVGTISPNIGLLSELITLNLSRNGLTGGIPSALGLCTKLQVLDLSYNTLSAVIPTEMGSLVALRKVYLGHNQFVGTLTFPYAMASLTELSLEYNQLNGYPLTSLTSISSIVYLNLGFNSFSGTIDNNDLPQFNATLEQLILGSNSFQGPVPTTLSYLSGLVALDLGANRFAGPVPVQIQYCVSLSYLNMSFNQINGSIPGIINKLVSLSVLDLRGNSLVGDIQGSFLSCILLTDLRVGDNQLNGTIPTGIRDLSGLITLDLSSNSFTGTIPDDLVELPLRTLNLSANQLTGGLVELGSGIQVVDFSTNLLTGPILASYGSLPALTTLSLACNELTGKIPSNLGLRLRVLNLTTNSLTGPIPRGLAKANLSVFSVAMNKLKGKVPDTPVMRSFYPQGFIPGNPGLCGVVMKKACPLVPPWAAALLGIFVPLAAGVLGALLYAKLFPRGDYTAKSVRSITDDFNSANLIGIGGTSTVYKGTFPDGKDVAVKRLRPEYLNNRTNFELERKLLLDVKHPNIAEVIGSCSSGNLKALILEYAPNGNLDMHLHHGENVLPWNTRMDIAAGVAQGLAYLHGEWQAPDRQSPDRLHADIKASSVLLDEKLSPKVTDVRLATPSNVREINYAGVIGYMPPEYALSPGPTMAGDVYSYGSLMMELLTGVKPYGAVEGSVQAVVRQQFPDNLQAVIDPQIWNGPYTNQIAVCTKIALHCTNDLPDERPNMQEVLQLFGQAYSVEPQEVI